MLTRGGRLYLCEGDEGCGGWRGEERDERVVMDCVLGWKEKGYLHCGEMM